MKESIRKTEMYLLTKKITIPIKTMHSNEDERTLPGWKTMFNIISITKYMSKLISKPSASERRSRWKRLRVKFGSVRYKSYFTGN